MKIAIQGHPTRGKEVIQILESLGGKNIKKWHGTGDIRDGFFIDSDGIIEFDNLSKGYKLYTLEEFEKEFPFKIGDKVIYSYTPNFVGTVVNIKFNDNIPYRVDIEGTICTCGTNMLKSYKEIQEERNITLTLDKAREWYNKGGELKEIALQAFSEKELNSLPKSWEEYCRKYEYTCFSTRYTNIPLKYDALLKLEQLRDCWRQGWKPDYTKTYKKYRIKKLGTEYIVDWSTGLSDFLVFQTEELAKEFLKCFKDLIEKAGDLI